MIKIPTVFILGAGASEPYGYPTGDSLLKKMIALTKDSEEINLYVEAKRLPTQESIKIHNLVYELKNALEIGQPKSIDSFLEKRTDFHEIGKYLIAKAISSEEKNHRELLKTIPNQINWMKYLKDSMLDDTYEKIIENKVTFITFNYDMSLEKYFWDALKFYYKEPAPTDFFRSIKIHHIHGKLKQFPWENEDFIDLNNRTVSNAKSVIKMSEGIKLIHENHKNDKNLEAAQEAIASCERIFFLGFGYHHNNIKKLDENFFQNTIVRGQQCFGTVLGKTEGEIKRIVSESNLPPNMNLQDVGCCDLLRMYADKLF